MKKIRIGRPSFAVLFLVVLAAFALARPAGILLARLALKSVFGGSAVSVGAVRFHLPARCTMSGVSVIHPLYQITVKEATAVCTADLLRGEVASLLVDNAVISVSLGARDITELARLLPVRSGGRPGLFRLRDVELRRTQIKVQSRTCAAQGLLSVKADLGRGVVLRMDAALDSFSYEGLTLERASVSMIQGEQAGFLYCGSVAYGKIAVKNIESPIELKGARVTAARITASLLGGELLGASDITLSMPVGYRCSLRARGLEFADLVRQFKIEDKFTASGPLEGTLTVEGSGSRVSAVDGDFHSTQPGVLSIRDRRIIENIGSTMPARVTAELLMETLRNYKYNKGTIATGLTDDGLTSTMLFEGEAGGKIAFTVVLHPAVRNP